MNENCGECGVMDLQSENERLFKEQLFKDIGALLADESLEDLVMFRKFLKEKKNANGKPSN